MHLKHFLTGLAAAFATASTASPAFAETITGFAEVIDSDILQIGDYEIYLLGVESIEGGQTCQIDEQVWECYPAAVRMLETIAMQGELVCEVASGPNFLGQTIAVCTSNGDDIGAQLVRSGFALTIPDETDDYEDELAAAMEEEIGLWQGRFILPSVWRTTFGVFADRPRYRPITPDQ